MTKKGGATRRSQEMANFKRKQMILTGIFIVVVAYLVIVFFPAFAPSFGSQSSVTVAKVDGEAIHLHDLKTQYEMLPKNQQHIVTYELLLNRTIEEMLLLNKAEQDGIAVSEDEVIESIDGLSRGMSREDLDRRLATHNLTYDDLREMQYRELMIGKLINRTVMSPIEVSQEDIQSRYHKRYQNNTIYELRHVVLEREKDARQVKRALELGVPYHALVMEYPQEAKDIRNDGIIGYITPQDSRYSDISNLSINQTRIFRKDASYEVIQVTGIIHDPTFQKVGGHIKEDMVKRKRSARLLELLDELKEEAKIVVYKDRLPDHSSSPESLSS